jgi:hypothetical protein
MIYLRKFSSQVYSNIIFDSMTRSGRHQSRPTSARNGSGDIEQQSAMAMANKPVP